MILQHDDYNELVEKNKEKDIIIDILRSENELHALSKTVLRVLEELEGKINTLTEDPNRGFKFGDRYRAIVHKHYTIIYKVDEENKVVVILSIR